MTPKAKKREKRRAQRLYQAKLRKENKAQLEDEAEIEEIEGEEEDLDEISEDLDEELALASSKESGTMEKDYHGDMPMPMMEMEPVGPTSWEELDSARDAMEAAEAVQEVSYDARSLVRNILNHPMMAPDEQARALKGVANGFGDRAKSAMGDMKKEREDVEVLEIEALIAKDNRSMGIPQKLVEFLFKKKLSSEARNKLPDSAFALPEKRKYPIHDKAHIRNALARAAQMMKRGGMDAEDAKAAMPKIRAAAKRMGIGEMSKEKSGVLIQKDESGTWRWIGWPTNKYIDSDKEILSEASHREYVDWVNKNMEFAPAFTTWHSPDLVRKSHVDVVDYIDGFVVASGPLTEEEAIALFKAQKLTDIGMSHGSFALERDPQDSRVITKYRTFEYSDLPLENAANPYTGMETISKEAKMDKVKYLAPFLGGEEQAKAFLEKTALNKEKLEEAKVESKEKAPEKKTETKDAPPTVDIKALVKAVSEELGMDDLSKTIEILQEEAEKVPVLEALVKSMSANQDEALAEKINPLLGRKFAWQTARASQKESSVLNKDKKEDKELGDAIAQLPDDWASLGVEPLKQS